MKLLQAVFFLGILACLGQATAPATAPAKPMTLIEVAGKLPKELWPGPKESEIKIAARNGWFEKNGSGQTVALTFQVASIRLFNGNIEINAKPVVVQLFGMSLTQTSYVEFSAERASEFVALKPGDTITVTGRTRGIGLNVDNFDARKPLANTKGLLGVSMRSPDWKKR